MILKRKMPSLKQRLVDGFNKNPLKILGMALGACAVVLLVFIVTGIIVVSGINREIGVRNEKIDVLKQAFSALAGDYNLLRQSLGLEARDFPLLEENSGAMEATGSPLVEGLKLMQNRFNDEKRSAVFQEIRTSGQMNSILKEIGATAFDTGPFSTALVKQGDIRFALTYQPDQALVKIQAAGIADAYAGTWDKSAADFIRSAETKVAAYYVLVVAERRRLQTIADDPAVAALLEAKGLVLQSRPEDFSRLQAAIARGTDEFLTLTFDKLLGSWSIASKKIESPEKMPEELAAALEKLDTRSPMEREVDAVTLSLKESFLDPEFSAFLKEAELAVSSSARETDEFRYFDVTQAGVKVGAFAVNRRNAEVYFVDKDDVQIMALRTLAGNSDYKKKTVTDSDAAARYRELFSGTDAAAFLLLGQNEENTDTMILVQANPKTQTVSLVSLPRDLYYRGMRINKLAEQGYDHCVREISSITGVPIEKFAVVDIYSLMSLIDVLGGVDIYLERDLIDPTYRIKENGVWQTLAYPRGQYHLTGVQALRIIRSRATTTDFGRAYRQQMILAALFEKLKKRCGESVEVALQVFSSLLVYVKTNVAPLELARYFFTFKDYRVASPHVVDTSNILKQTWTALLYASEEEQEQLLAENDISKLGGWILLPKNNDWNLLRSYIRVILSGS